MALCHRRMVFTSLLWLAVWPLVMSSAYAEPPQKPPKRQGAKSKVRPSASSGKSSGVRAPGAVAAAPGAQSGADPRRTDVVEGMAQIKAQAQACFERFRVPGVVVVKLLISAAGKVTSAAAHGELAGSSTADCILELARAGEFRIVRGDAYSLSFPIVLGTMAE